VITSSQSLDLVVENDSDAIGGYLRDERGMERFVAFFAKEPKIHESGTVKMDTKMRCDELTLAQFEAPGIPHNAGAS
jgi:hypothetical protein